MDDQNSLYVVRVIDEYTLVIDGGRNRGLKEGQKFAIYALSDEDIIHPVTNENLGKLEIVKGTGSIVSIQEKLATIESNKTEKTTTKTKITKRYPLASIYMGKVGDEIVEELNPPELQPFKNVSVGDFARRIPG